MKKTFSLEHPKVNVARRVEAIKHEVKKYQTRERKKPLPAGADYWDFDCKFGATEAEAVEIHVSEINKHISDIEQQGQMSFYLEVIAQAKVRPVRTIAESEFEDEAADESAADNVAEQTDIESDEDADDSHR